MIAPAPCRTAATTSLRKGRRPQQPICRSRPFERYAWESSFGKLFRSRTSSIVNGTVCRSCWSCARESDAMRLSRSGGLTFINAEIGGAERASLRILGSRIAALGSAPEVDDLVVDLHGDRLLPGLINAH